MLLHGIAKRREGYEYQSEISKLRTVLQELTEKCRPYLEALKAVKELIDGILERFKKQEKSIYYEPISACKQQLLEHENILKLKITRGRKTK